MPLTEKGEAILAKMKKTYGSEKKAKQVFYAARNKGTINGVEARQHRKYLKAREALERSWRR